MCLIFNDIGAKEVIIIIINPVLRKQTQLLECCDEDNRRDLTRTAGGTVTGKEEAEVLTAIKTMAVRPENTMVARATLHNMRQDRDEAIRSFGARIQGQAGICKHTIKCQREACNANTVYTDAILRDVLARGIADQEIQLDLLGDQNQDMSLEDVNICGSQRVRKSVGIQAT